MNTYKKDKTLDKRYRTHNKKLILMPRGSFKTSCVTIGLTIQEILKDPNIRILIDSETWDKSKDFLSEIKGHLENNQKFIDMFGRLKPESDKESKWTASAITIATRTRNRKEPTVSTAGIGVTKVGMHYDMIIMDDLHSQNNITTPEMIQAVIDHYRLALSLLEPNGKLVIIGTRWDYSDLYSWIIDNEKKSFSVYKKSAIEDGKLLFPSRLTRHFLAEQKRSMGSYLYSCQYMNTPVDDETALFKQSDFRYFKMDDIKDKLLNIFVSVDPAISTESYADYSVVLTAGQDESFNIYILDIQRERVSPDELIKRIEESYFRFNAKMVTIETTAYQKALKFAIDQHMKESGHYMSVIESPRDSRVSKDMRIRSLEPRYRNGQVFHLKGGNNVENLEYELLHYPRYKHDDILDALADQLTCGYRPRKKKHHFRRRPYMQGKYVAI